MEGNLKTARNVAIVIAIAAAVYFLPGGGRAASTFAAALWTAFAIGIGYFGLFMYRERRVWMHGLGDRHRAILYGAVAVGVFEWVARSRMWSSEVGKPLWWVLAASVVYGLYLVYRRARAY
jgi:TRAP-type C4-dicarboxylate transport system permease small subunit